jgi:hypothetical protein
LSTKMFGAPEIRISNNEAGFRPEQTHGVQSLMRSSR